MITGDEKIHPQKNAYFPHQFTTSLQVKTNDSPEISPIILWETAKAVMRGKILPYSTNNGSGGKNINHTEANLKKKKAPH